ncbi:hypothetical protein [Deinococcus misasensis]|nr:hypothetical protein [Deinococcus misasensis]
MIRFEQVSHTFKSGTRALSQVNFEVQARDFTVFMGPIGPQKAPCFA